MLKKILLCLILVVVLAALAFFLLAGRPPRAQSFQAHGTTASLEAVTFGLTNLLVASQPWRKSLYRLLPAKYKSWSDCFFIPSNTSFTNSPVFWVRLKNPSQDFPNLGTISRKLVDEYGTEYEGNGSAFGSTTIARHESVCYYALGSLSPHGQIVGIAFHDYTNHQKLGQFLIPGKKILPLPASQPSPSLPQKSGDLTFQLTEFVTGLRTAPDSLDARGHNPVFTRATFRIDRNGVPAPDWFVKYIKVADSHGGHEAPWMYSRGVKGDACTYNFEGTLDPAAAPWKLEAEFTHQTDFSSDELVTFQHVPFPSVGYSFSPQLKTNVQGITLTVEHMYNGGGGGPKTGFQPNQPFVEASVGPNLPDFEVLLVTAIDEHGKNIMYGSYAPQGNGRFCMSFAPGATARFTDLTFAVHRSRTITFEATPVPIFTNGSPVK